MLTKGEVKEGQRPPPIYFGIGWGGGEGAKSAVQNRVSVRRGGRNRSCDADSLQRRALCGEELPQTPVAEVEEFVHLSASERVALAGALDLDELARLGAHDVEVERGPVVFFVRQVQQRHSIDNAGTDRGDGAVHGYRAVCA